MKNLEKIFSQKIIFNLFLICIMIQAESVDAMDSYIRELLPGSRTSFKHWNLERSEVTGYSHNHYEELVKEGTRFVVEKMKTLSLMARCLLEKHFGLNQILECQNGMRKKIYVKILG